MIPAHIPVFRPDAPLKCPDCECEEMEFFDHCLVGWLCRECYERVQAACERLARYKVSA